MATRSTRAKKQKNDEGDLAPFKPNANEKIIDDIEADQENVELNIGANKKIKGRGRILKNRMDSPVNDDKDADKKPDKNEKTTKLNKKNKIPVGKGNKVEHDDKESNDTLKDVETRNKPKEKLAMVDEFENKTNSGENKIKEDSENEIKPDAINTKQKVKKGVSTKKEEKMSSNNDNEVVPTAVETKTKQSAKGKKDVNKNTDIEKKNDSEDPAGEPPNKKSKKEDKPLKNKSSTTYDSIDFENSSVDSRGQPWNFKISSWNVDGIRAWLSKGGLEYIKREKPDILCLQEVKCSQEKLPKEATAVEGYHPYWLCSDKDGYAGVCIYTTKVPINVKYGLHDEDLDSEGRIITAEYDQFYLICTYVPNAGRKLVTLPKKLKWNEMFHKFVKDLDSKKPVIICGDMNVAHNEIDLTNPKTNKKNAGFTEEERAGMTALLNDGFVDTFRHLNPDKTGAYTFWTYMMNSRAKNVGWRLDYMIVSERMLPSVCDNVIRSEVFGSDHCPITLCLNLKSD